MPQILLGVALMAVTEGLTGVLMRGWSSALVVAVAARLFATAGAVLDAPPKP
jgi:hypothetical protein